MLFKEKRGCAFPLLLYSSCTIFVTNLPTQNAKLKIDLHKHLDFTFFIWPSSTSTIKIGTYLCRSGFSWNLPENHVEKVPCWFKLQCWKLYQRTQNNAEWLVQHFCVLESSLNLFGLVLGFVLVFLFTFFKLNTLFLIKYIFHKIKQVCWQITDKQILPKSGKLRSLVYTSIKHKHITH